MSNYKFEIAYDGTRYNGWEKKSNGVTIQEKLENVLAVMTGQDAAVIGAGRTDAGVHAKAMVANSHFESEKTEAEILEYMNRYLPDDICVNSVVKASDRFHARYNARGKTYTYTCYFGPRKPVFDRKYVYVLDFEPDVEAMIAGARFLTGNHDFSAFCTNRGKNKSSERILDSLEIVKKRSYLYLNYHADGFLHNMVRIMTGTLLEVGRGNIKPEEVGTILESLDRRNAGHTAPPCGLTLVGIDY